MGGYEISDVLKENIDLREGKIIVLPQLRTRLAFNGCQVPNSLDTFVCVN